VIFDIISIIDNNVVLRIISFGNESEKRWKWSWNDRLVRINSWY